jgi:hypothetical protein
VEREKKNCGVELSREASGTMHYAKGKAWRMGFALLKGKGGGHGVMEFWNLWGWRERRGLGCFILCWGCIFDAAILKPCVLAL